MNVMMENIYAVKSNNELIEYQNFVKQIQPRLIEYIDYLKSEYAVSELPKSIVWTSYDIATKLISNIPIPAYTNDFRVVITPSIDAWRRIYLAQLSSIAKGKNYEKLQKYYNSQISINHILQILGHELAHHIPFFMDEEDTSLDSGIWFEEGMVEYISRRYFLTANEFSRAHENNLILVNALRSKYGKHSLDEFGAATYEGDLASIFFEYWRSYLAVHAIVDDHNGDIHKVFASYQDWYSRRNDISLLEWFGVEEMTFH